MVVDWKQLLIAQRTLDQYTFEQKGLDYNATRKNRFLALMVELNELANETKAFKFWSNKTNISREKILEEYVDVLHFTLSVYCSEGIENLDLEPKSMVNQQEHDFVVNFLLELIVELAKIWGRVMNKSGFSVDDMKDFRGWTVKFLELSSHLGFTWWEVMEAYDRKRLINVDRQKSGSY